MRVRRDVAGRRRLLPAVAALAMGGPLVTPAVPRPTAVPALQTLPPQPGTIAPSCLPQPGTPGRWVFVTGQGAAAEVPLDQAPAFPAPGYQITVDPQLPCRMYRARSAQTLERSVDSGTTWTTVFHDEATAAPAGLEPICTPPALQSACAATGAPFTASGLAVLSSGVPGMVALSERGSGDGVVVSYDSGATWTLAGGAAGPLAGLAGHRVLHLLAARDGDPSHALFGYATASPVPASAADSAIPPPQTVYVTTDGGRTWLPSVWPGPPGALSTLPPAPIDATAVLPDIPMLVWSVSGGRLYRGLSASTSTGGPTTPMTWVDSGAVPDATTAQLLVSSGGGHLRAYVVGAGGDLHYTEDVMAGSVTWRQVVLPAGVRVTAAAVSAFAGQVLVTATDASHPGGHRVRVFYLRDGLMPVTEVSAPPAGDGDSADATVRTPLLSAAGALTPPEAILQADTRGNFYLGVTACTVHRQGSCELETQTYWRYTPPPLPATRGGGMDGTTTLPVQPLTELMDCPLGSAGTSSPLAFDGVDLIYPDPSSQQRAPYTDVVDVLPTATCLTTPVRRVTVHFRAQDRGYAQCYGTCSQIRIDDMTYDPTRHLLWFVAGQTPPFNGILFTAPWPVLGDTTTDVWAQVAFAPRHHPNGCGGAGASTSYDVSDDSLWTCSYDPGGNIIGDHIRAADGADIPDHCPSGWSGPSYAAPGFQYLWSEDDTTIDQLSDASCAAVRTYVHRPVVEPVAEDEQLVCDPLTFTTARGWPGPEQTVFWLRESGLNQVIAFATADPAATCPLPTAVTAIPSPPTACGQLMTLSAVLRLAGPGLPLPLQVVDVAVDGVPAGSAVTGPDGVATLRVPAPMRAGQYEVTARFAGSARLLPSAGLASTTVTSLGCPPPVTPPRVPAAPVRPGILIVIPPPPPGPHPVPEPVPGAQAAAAGSEVQAQAQAEVQAHVQAQSAAQTQPGMVTQAQAERQLARRTARTATPAVLHATAVSVERMRMVVPVVVGLALLRLRRARHQVHAAHAMAARTRGHRGQGGGAAATGLLGRSERR